MATYVEEPHDVAQAYWPKEQLEEIKKRINDLAQDQPQLLHLLTKGRNLNVVALDLLEKGRKLSKVHQAVQFLNKLALYATIIPFFVTPKGGSSIAMQGGQNDVWILAERLRKVSYYPRILEEVIIPLAREELAAVHIRGKCKELPGLFFLSIKRLIMGKYLSLSIQIPA